MRKMPRTLPNQTRGRALHTRDSRNKTRCE
nr:MAG TPA: hypothetical protein [Caudoviricetes sp.]